MVLVRINKSEDIQKGMEFEEYFQYTPSPNYPTYGSLP